MKRLALSLALVLAPLTVAACGASANSIEMKGGDQDLALLAGEWEGSYQGIESGRSGQVSFSLQVGRHTADGTVLMDGATPLKIQFVAVEGGTVTGKIAPYTDPQCSCEVETEFSGTVIGDAIVGSFTTKVLGQELQSSGEWSVQRKSS